MREENVLLHILGNCNIRSRPLYNSHAEYWISSGHDQIGLDYAAFCINPKSLL